MRTRAIIGGVLASAAVIIGAWEAGQPHTRAASAQASVTSSAPDASGAPQASGTSGGGSTSTGSSGTSGTSGTSGYRDGTFTGSTAGTRYGDVQVQVVVSGGRITAVNALHLTDADGRSVMISRYAAPLLQQEVLSAQSAQVDTISGATTTSEGYLQSLQAALDEAR